MRTNPTYVHLLKNTGCIAFHPLSVVVWAYRGYIYIIYVSLLTKQKRPKNRGLSARCLWSCWRCHPWRLTPRHRPRIWPGIRMSLVSQGTCFGMVCIDIGAVFLQTKCLSSIFKYSVLWIERAPNPKGKPTSIVWGTGVEYGTPLPKQMSRFLLVSLSSCPRY